MTGAGSSVRRLVGVLVAATVVMVALASASSASAAKPLVHVVRPADDAVFRVDRARGCQTVRLRLGRGARLTLAVLNGERVRSRFRGSGRVLSARLCTRDGLRLGRNRLRLRARHGRVSTPARLRFIRARPGSGLVAGGVARGRRGLVAAYRPARSGIETIAVIGGRRIPARYQRDDKGVTRTRLSASSGLRHGRSLFRVRGVSPAGRISVLDRVVTVSPSAPIAGAGANQRIRVGQTFVLDGSDSLAARGTRRALDYSWRVISAPAGSGAVVAEPGDAVTGLRVDRPGLYEALLTVTDPVTGRSSRDAVSATVDPQPLAPISTLSSANGKPGVLLETSRFCGDPDDACFYENGGGPGTVQLVVLDRDTLALHSDSSGDYNRSYAPDASGMNQLNVDLSKVSSDTLAIVTLGSGAVSDVADFSAAIKRIGAQPFASGTSSVSGPFSIIGVPGMIVGKAWTNYRQSLDGGAAGSLDGYVKESAYYTQGALLEADQRVFTYGDVRSYDTRVGTSEVQVQVGTYDPSTRAFQESPLATFAAANGGLGIATFDALTLAPKSSTVYAPQSSSSGLAWSSIQAVLEAAATSGDGVVITSLGKFGGFASEPDAPSFLGVLNAIASLGGQPDVLARAANTDGATYSFISSANVGAESSSVILADVDDQAFESPVREGGLTGSLQRGPDGRFIVFKGDPAGLYRPTLAAVLAQDPIAWPDTPASPSATVSGVELALAWLASCEATAGGVIQPRPALWTNPSQSCSVGVEASAPTGASVVQAGAVRDVSLTLRADYQVPGFAPTYDADYATAFPNGNALISEADFNAARQQLLAEAQALAEVQGWFASVACEVSTACQGDTVASNLNAVSTKITDAYFAQTETTTTRPNRFAGDLFMHWANGIAKVLDLFAGDQEEVKAVLQPFFLFTGLMGDGGESFLTSLAGHNQSTSLNAESWLILQNQLTNATASVDEQVEQALGLQALGVGFSEQIVLSDWGRMQTVAANSTNGDTSSPNGWQISAGQLNESAPDTLTVQVRQNAWGAYTQQLWAASRVSSPSASSCEVGDGPFFPFREAFPGEIPGLGNDRQYWPLISISTANGIANHWTYVVFQQSWSNPTSQGGQGAQGTSTTALVPESTWTPIFASPTALSADQTAAGQYGPWFWRNYLGLTQQGSCQGGDGAPSSLAFRPVTFYGLSD